MLLAAVALSLLLAVPASAAGELSVSVPTSVTGRDALRLTPSGLQAPVLLDITITDTGGAVATWRYPAALVGDGKALSIDLSLPDSGTPPRNGRARIAVSGPAVAVADATTTIDRSPPMPSLRTVVRGQRVGVTWDAVAAPDPVTYKLERIVTGGAWTVVESSQSADGFTDRELEPGRYRYRLTAGVPSADGGTNWSRSSATQLKIAAPAPSPSVAPPTPKPATEPAAKQPGAPTKPKAGPGRAPKPRRQERPRSVAATGTVRGPLTDEDTRVPLETNPTPLIATADEPAVSGAAPPMTSHVTEVATPEVAAPAVPAPHAASPPAPPPVQPFGAFVPPAGSLAVAAATRTPPDPVSLLSGLVFLLFAAGAVARIRRRTGRAIIPAWVGRR